MLICIFLIIMKLTVLEFQWDKYYTFSCSVPSPHHSNKVPKLYKKTEPLQLCLAVVTFYSGRFLLHLCSSHRHRPINHINHSNYSIHTAITPATPATAVPIKAGSTWSGIFYHRAGLYGMYWMYWMYWMYGASGVSVLFGVSGLSGLYGMYGMSVL